GYAPLPDYDIRKGDSSPVNLKDLRVGAGNVCTPAAAALGTGSSRSPTPDRTRSAQIRGIVQFQRLLIRLRSANATIDRGIPSSDRIEKRVITLSHRNRSCRSCKE